LIFSGMSGMSVTNRGLHQNKTRDENLSPPEQLNMNGSSSILHILKKHYNQTRLMNHVACKLSRDLPTYRKISLAGSFNIFSTQLTKLYHVSTIWYGNTLHDSFITFRKTISIWVQEVLGRTNRQLSLIPHGPHRKRCVQQFFYCCVRIRCSGKVFTKPLPSNKKGIHI
jgi:hypothetical protein